MNRTIAALATPPGIGGIAVIRLSGSEAFAIADKCFLGKILLTDSASHTLHYGKILHDGNIVDTVVASVFHEPNSYTGENVVEISCHGGMLVANEILDILYSYGAEPATAGEFTKRAFLNGKMDLAQVEAVADIIHSVSVPGCLTAARQLDGQFTERLKTLRRKLIDIAVLIEIELDFSEEDIQFVDRSRILKTMRETENYCKGLCDSFRASEILRSGYFVAIAGYPNSGKSTLFNSLLNRKRAIVSEFPGTTRDYLEETLFLNGIAVKLIDTAGFRDSVNIIEIEGIKFAESLLEQANLIFVINDISVSENNSHKLFAKIKSKYKSAGVVMLQNKFDLIKDSHIQHEPIANKLYISAKFGFGIEGLKEFILEEAKKSTARINDILINQRHAQLLALTAKYLEFAIDSIKTCRETELVAIDIRSAASKLGEITGDKWSEEVLNNIFDRFCIGK